MSSDSSPLEPAPSETDPVVEPAPEARGSSPLRFLAIAVVVGGVILVVAGGVHVVRRTRSDL